VHVERTGDDSGLNGVNAFEITSLVRMAMVSNFLEGLLRVKQNQIS